MANNGDITIFPVCMRCNFDNLLINAKMAKEQQLGALLSDDKPHFFPTSKRLFEEENLHRNSEEFKQLGTMTQEARTSAYYPSEMPQPKTIPVTNKKAIEKIIPTTQPTKEPRQKSSIANSGRVIMESDRTRASQIKSMISEKMNVES